MFRLMDARAKAQLYAMRIDYVDQRCSLVTHTHRSAHHETNMLWTIWKCVLSYWFVVENRRRSCKYNFWFSILFWSHAVAEGCAWNAPSAFGVYRPEPESRFLGTNWRCIERNIRNNSVKYLMQFVLCLFLFREFLLRQNAVQLQNQSGAQLARIAESLTILLFVKLVADSQRSLKANKKKIVAKQFRYKFPTLSCIVLH